MDYDALLDFAPAPSTGRQDGWTATRQILFIAGLARGFSAGKAARSIGMSRQGAYALRTRPGGESFAQAWDRAVEMASRERALRSERRPDIHFPDGFWRPRTYRGEITGWVHSNALPGAMRTLSRLDRAAEAIPAGIDSAGLDTLFDAVSPRRLPTAPRRDGSDEIDNVDEIPAFERRLRPTGGRSGGP